MGIKLNSSSGGSVEINPPATASTFTLTVPAVTGNIITNADSGTVTGTMIAANTITANNMLYKKTYGAPTVTNTGATSYEYNNIPSWANRITIMFWNVSGSGSSNMKIQVGNSASWVTGTVYYHEAQYGSPGSSSGVDTGFSLHQVVAAGDRSDGKMILDRFALTGSANANVWSAINAVETEGQAQSGGGCVDVGTELTRLRLIATNGTDTFDSGQFNIIYEP